MPMYCVYFLHYSPPPLSFLQDVNHLLRCISTFLDASAGQDDQFLQGLFQLAKKCCKVAAKATGSINKMESWRELQQFAELAYRCSIGGALPGTFDGCLQAASEMAVSRAREISCPQRIFTLCDPSSSDEAHAMHAVVVLSITGVASVMCRRLARGTASKDAPAMIKKLIAWIGRNTINQTWTRYNSHQAKKMAAFLLAIFKASAECGAWLSCHADEHLGALATAVVGLCATHRRRGMVNALEAAL